MFECSISMYGHLSHQR
uniref:Uncharacterized protein n=1 Tax=Anguilla anguilla TaxID=7936 RepID=A0A0E9PF75_ANGAN